MAGIPAQQVIVGRLPGAPAPIEAYAAIATEAVDLEEPTREERRARLHALADADWVLHLDADEEPTPELAAVLADLLADAQTVAWRVPRQILSTDGTSWHDESPWWPALSTRLVRRGTDLHAPIGRTRITSAPLLVRSAVERTADEREELVLRREIVELAGPGHAALRGPAVRRALPERFATRPPEPLSGPAPEDEGDRVVRPLERDARFVIGEPRAFLVEVVNRTNEVWSSAGDSQSPRHRVSYRWTFPDGSTVEGHRTDLPRPLQPGEREILAMHVDVPPTEGPAVLTLAVVHEFVAWLEGSTSLDATVVALEEPPFRREVRPGGAAIPKVIHRVWLGGKPMPEAHVEYGRTWERLHPEWEVRLWTDADAPIPACADRARSISEVSDLVRYEILRQHGGVYVDTDIECLRPIDELLDGVTAFSAYEVPGRLCPALMGAIPGHPAFERLCELVEITVGHGHYPENTATVLSTFGLEPRGDVTLFGPDRFYPQLWDGTRSGDGEAPYADHHWAMSWNT